MHGHGDVNSVFQIQTVQIFGWDFAQLKIKTSGLILKVKWKPDQKGHKLMKDMFAT